MSEISNTARNVERRLRTWTTGLIGCLSLGVLLGCQTPNAQTQAQQNRGVISIKVQFPKRGFQTQLIKPETRVIYVAVYRQDLASEKPQIYGPITPQNAQVRLHHLPAGTQTVIAAAYDANRQILTAGQSKAFVRANAVTQASLELESEYGQRLQADQLRLLQQLQIQTDVKLAQAADLQPQSALINAAGVFQSGGTRSQADAAATTQLEAARPAQVTPEPAAVQADNGQSASGPAQAEPVRSQTLPQAPVQSVAAQPTAVQDTPAAGPSAAGRQNENHDHQNENDDENEHNDRGESDDDSDGEDENDDQNRESGEDAQDEHENDEDDHKNDDDDEDDGGNRDDAEKEPKDDKSGKSGKSGRSGSDTSDSGRGGSGRGRH